MARWPTVHFVNVEKHESIKYIVDTCPSIKFEEGFEKLHDCGLAAVKWLEEFTIGTSVCDFYYYYKYYYLFIYILLGIIVCLFLPIYLVCFY